ncbi:hypothetical protein [Streptomyces sp. Tue6028]|uniref:hypothetical protein n=1 Tax=Streptomyces sp. Tue6028 TaxID=2036037 RepID=UPI003D734DE1
MPVLAAQLDDEPRYTWGTRLTASANAGPNARLRVRIRLTVAHWSGNGEAAARVADKLVDNAFCHAQPIGPGEGWVELRLTVLPTTDHLLVEVDDAMPEFPCFESASTAEPAGPPPGLWWVRHYRGALSWGPKTDNATGDVVGKTVAAILPTTWAAAS